MNRPFLNSGRAGQTRAGQTRSGRRCLAGGRATRLGAALAVVAALALAGCSTSAGQASGQVNMAETRLAAAAAPDNPNAPGFWYGTDSATIPITSRAALPGTRRQRQATVRRLHRDGRELVPLVRLRRRAGLVGGGQQGREHQLQHVSQGHRHRRLLVHGRSRVDPHYTGTTAEASAWGAAQAAKTLRAIGGRSVTYKVVWMDVELPGNAPNYTPAPDNGWNNVYTSTCSGRVRTPFVAASLDRAVLNGYSSYLTAHSSYTPGVYSSPLIWSSIFGTGSASSIPNLDEWTYTNGTRHISPPPIGWCVPGTSTCARFFGGVTRSSVHAVMWQWSGGGGITNGVGDFDQIDTNHVK